MLYSTLACSQGKFMMLFLKKYFNLKLVFLTLLQIVVLVFVFSFFFLSIGANFPQAILGAVIVFLLFYLLFRLLMLPFFIFPQIKGAVYVPSSDERIKDMLELAKLKKNDVACDIGSGDGRVVIELAKHCKEAHGVELNPVLVQRSEKNIKAANLEKKAKIFWKSFWDTDLSEYDVITVYGINYIMKNLEKKLEQDLNPGARVISNYFVFPNWKPVKKKNDVYLYVMK